MALKSILNASPAPLAKASLLFALVIPLSACQTTDVANSVGGAMSLASTLDTSPERERQVALQGESQILQKMKVSSDRALAAHLNQMTGRLAKAAGGGSYPYKVTLIADKNVNAFTTGAGRLFVTTGLVRVLDNEAQMAAVLAHEMAHVTESHVVRGMRDKTAILVGAQVGASAAGVDGLLAQVAYKYAVSAVVNGHGRSFETTADKIGLKYMVAAGYDGREAPKVFGKFIQLYGKKSGVVNFFHGDHPTNVDRIKTLNKELAGKYRGKDFARATRNTAAYARLTAKYRR